MFICEKRIGKFRSWPFAIEKERTTDHWLCLSCQKRLRSRLWRTRRGRLPEPNRGAGERAKSSSLGDFSGLEEFHDCWHRCKRSKSFPLPVLEPDYRVP